MKFNYRKNILPIAIAMIASSLTACNKEFEKTNTNPNNIEVTDPKTLFSNVIVSEFYNNASNAWSLGNAYSQYITNSYSYYNQPLRYQAESNSTFWDELYYSARDANILYTATTNPAVEAAALTLRSYAFAQLTELWGNIPFKNALNGSQVEFTSTFDTQQTVYTDNDRGIIPCLKRADSLFSVATTADFNSTEFAGGDLLFSGNSTKWRGFVNALRLRYLMRVSAKTDVSAEMQTIASNTSTLIQDATSGAILTLPTTTPYNFPSTTARSGDFTIIFMNDLLYNTFKNTNDANRMGAYFAANSNNSTTTTFDFSYFGGMPMVTDATTAQASAASLFNANFNSSYSTYAGGATSNSNVIKAKVISYSEQEFILAEAALKGLISGTASTYYNSGVLGAYTELGLSGGSNYLANTNVTLSSNTATALDQIITQKWLNNLGNSFEGWVEFRRTGYPTFSTGGSANLDNGKIPYRFLYPDDERTINSTNYNTAVQLMGGTDDTNYKGWWDN